MDSLLSTQAKVCRTCGERKGLDFFYKSARSKDGAKSQCKSCEGKRRTQRKQEWARGGLCYECGKVPVNGTVLCKECSSRHSGQGRQRWSKRSGEGLCCKCGKQKATEGYKTCDECREFGRVESVERRKVFSAVVGDYFNNSCYICREVSRDYEVFECHHLDPSKKSYQIAHMINMKWPTVITELEKCVYLCSNCHRRLHGGRFDKELESGNIMLVPGKNGLVGGVENG